MPIPDLLQQRIVDAFAAVGADPNHRLQPAKRLEIYHCLNPRIEPDAPQFARGWLGILTARRVLPVWHTYSPTWVDDNQLPDRLLAIAKNTLRGSLDIQKAWQEANDLWYIFGNLGENLNTRRTDVPNKAFYACDAALKALHEVFHIEFLEKAAEIDRASDDYLQDWERDSAASAMIAEAGGADAGVLDPRKRKEFWEWWIGKAVPMAWLRGVEPIP